MVKSYGKFNVGGVRSKCVTIRRFNWKGTQNLRHIREFNIGGLPNEALTAVSDFLCARACFKHVDACEYILLVSPTIVRQAKSNCVPLPSEFIRVLEQALKEGYQNEDDRAWIWVYTY